MRARPRASDRGGLVLYVPVVIRILGLLLPDGLVSVTRGRRFFGVCVTDGGTLAIIRGIFE